MTLNAWIQLGVFLVVLLVLARPLGRFMADVLAGESRVNRWFAPLERALYRLCGIDPEKEMHWRAYAIALVGFNALGALAVYALQRWQVWLPFNPQGLGAVTPDSSMNTAVSFVSNTNWQGYSGESTMSYLTQMLGLAVQNFMSAATGIAVVVALIRGFARHTAQTIGNFWVDMTRITLYILVPL